MSVNDIFNELQEFLVPDARSDVLESALGILLSLSTSEQLCEVISSEKELCEQLCTLFLSKNIPNRALLLSILVNLTAGRHSKDFASILLDSQRLIDDSTELFTGLQSNKNNICQIRAAQFLTNLSRNFPEKLARRLSTYDSKYLPKIISQIFDAKNMEMEGKMQRNNNSVSTFAGFVLINFSTIKSLGNEIVNDGLDSILALLSSTPQNNSKRLIGLEILYNLSMHDDLHGLLLRDEDPLLCALVAPLASAEDHLEEEETDKLPPGLQYWEGRRVEEPQIREKILSILYQFCATRLGREVLRRKGIYAILREFDRATGGAEELAVGRMVLVENGPGREGTDLLRALIGILVRAEEDMGLADEEEQGTSAASIRHLGMTRKEGDDQGMPISANICPPSSG